MCLALLSSKPLIFTAFLSQTQASNPSEEDMSWVEQNKFLHVVQKADMSVTDYMETI